ncbi:MAG: hypothetical protein K2O28_05350 [Clostridia bacterium]|nr:hypothetical protein [Clostridia bacterium]
MLHLLIESTDFVYIIVPLVVMLVVPSGMVIGDRLHRRVVEKQNGKLSGDTYRVRNNTYTFTGFIVAIIFIGIIALLFPIIYLCDIPNGPTLDITIIIVCVFGFLATVCLIFLIACKRWGITVSEEVLVFAPHFGKRITFTWKDINNMKCDHVGNFRIYLKNYDKKAIVFNPNIMVGGSKFLEDLKNHGILLVGTYI